jgi:hypothetical protein
MRWWGLGGLRCNVALMFISITNAHFCNSAPLLPTMLVVRFIRLFYFSNPFAHVRFSLFQWDLYLIFDKIQYGDLLLIRKGLALFLHNFSQYWGHLQYVGSFLTIYQNKYLLVSPTIFQMYNFKYS